MGFCNSFVSDYNTHHMAHDSKNYIVTSLWALSVCRSVSLMIIMVVLVAVAAEQATACLYKVLES